MSRQVYQVVKHGVTDGRDSGYPIEIRTGPLFTRQADAQMEADRLLAMLPEASRTTRVLLLNPATGTYGQNTQECPTYEVRSIDVLDGAQAADRVAQIRYDAARVRADRATRLRAEADALEAAGT